MVTGSTSISGGAVCCVGGAIVVVVSAMTSLRGVVSGARADRVVAVLSLVVSWGRLLDVGGLLDQAKALCD